MKTNQGKKLDAFDSKCHGNNSGHQVESFHYNSTNNKVRTQTKKTADVDHQTGLAGIFCTRLLPDRLANQVLQWNFQRQRQRGHSKMNWHHMIIWDLLRVTKGWSDPLRVTADQTHWSTLTASCVTQGGSTQVWVRFDCHNLPQKITADPKAKWTGELSLYEQDSSSH